MFSKIIKSFLGLLGIRVVRDSKYLSLVKLVERHRKILSILEMTISPDSRTKLLELLPKSNSQTGQDLFALVCNNFKRNGFYIEIGATDGVRISNTLILAKEYAWTGILCEPSLFWKESLIQNRSESRIETKCCWNQSGVFLDFLESNEKELSTISRFSSSDNYKKIRKRGSKYKVETISMLDMLLQNQAPKIVDFLSIDTEGSEFWILKDFPFNEYRFNCVVVEHNFGKHKSDILKLFTDAGYSQVCEDVSAQDFWFVPRTLL